MPYFYFWRETKRFPDDKARLQQPVLLIGAINIMHGVCNEIEKQEFENARKNK